jgi:hypothetical protein
MKRTLSGSSSASNSTPAWCARAERELEGALLSGARFVGARARGMGAAP